MTANATDTEGKYVASIEVTTGEIIITYGNEAHSNITAGTSNQLVLTPFLSIDESVVWRCGMANTGSSLSAMGANTGRTATTVPTQYLPSACRP